MAHNLYQMKSGGYAYTGRQAAWHELGTVKGDHFAWADVASEGGLNFEVEKRQLFSGNGDERLPEYQQVDAWGTFRTDNGQFLGAVGGEYTVIQHTRGFDMLDALVASKGGAHYETAGVLGKGETIWGLVDLNAALTVGAFDQSQPYLLFSTAHDGTKSHNYRLVFERVVCANTLAMALGEKVRNQLTVRHTKNSAIRIDKIHEVLGSIQGEITNMGERLNFLAGKQVTVESVESVMGRLFPQVKDEFGQPKDSTRRLNMIKGILERFERNDGNAYPEQSMTAYALLQGVTGWVDHDRDGVRGGKRAEAAMFGSGDRLKSQALEVITLAASGMPAKQTKVIYSTPSAPLTSLLDSIVEDHELALV